MSEKKNVYWFLIDGLSPLYMNISGNSDIKENFFDNYLKDAVVFSNVASTAGGTHCSMHSIFSSLLPSVNGASGWSKKALRRFNKRILTLTDYFKLEGYRTFRYSDADGERNVPMSGFDVWESSGYRIGEFLKFTCNGKCKRRDKFINLVNSTSNPKFVYHHVEVLHDLAGGLGTKWPSEKYVEYINVVSLEFEKLIAEYNINDNDVVIISSDHGVVLDKDYIEDGLKNGERQYEQSVRTIWGIKNSGISAQIIDTLISSLDEAPTICELVLNRRMIGQGKSLLCEMKSGAVEAEIVFREKGVYCTTPDKRNPEYSEIFYVRDKNWKYVYGIHEGGNEWLMDLDKDSDYQINLFKEYPSISQKYKKMLIDSMIKPVDTVESIYGNFDSYKLKKSMCFFSLVVNINEVNDEMVADLMDLAGPYYELHIVSNALNVSSDLVTFYKSVDQIDCNYLHGKYIVFIDEILGISEYFLSELYLAIENNSDIDFFQFNHGCAYKKIFWGRTEEIVYKKKIELRDAYDGFIAKESGRYTKEELLCEMKMEIERELDRESPVVIYGNGLDNEEIEIIFGKYEVSFWDERELNDSCTIVITSFLNRDSIQKQLLDCGFSGKIICLYNLLMKRYDIIQPFYRYYGGGYNKSSCKEYQVELYLTSFDEILPLYSLYKELAASNKTVCFVLEPRLINTNISRLDFERIREKLVDIQVEWKYICNPSAEVAVSMGESDTLIKYRNIKVSRWNKDVNITKNFF